MRRTVSLGAGGGDKDSKKDLIQHGVHLMLESLLQDLQGAEGQQLQALTALQGLARGSKQWSTVSFAAVQSAFREAGGFPLLVNLIATARSPRAGESGNGQMGAVATAAVAALSVLTRSNRANRDAAVAAGAVTALCTILGSGEEEPVSINVLRALYNLAGPAGSQAITMELFASGGVHALARLLRCVLCNAPKPHCNEWVREILTILVPLAGRSRLVAHLLVSYLPALEQLLTTCDEPLCLSLGLELLEELLNKGDRQRVVTQMAVEGLLAALVQVMHMRGLGTKAMLVLAGIAGDPKLLALLRATLEPADVACLAAMAVQEAAAEDLDAFSCRSLLLALLSSAELAILRSLVVARCLGEALALPDVGPVLRDKLANPQGFALLSNLPAAHATAVALAATQLLHSQQDLLLILRRPTILHGLLQEALAQHDADGLPPAQPLQALRTLLQQLPPDEDALPCASAFSERISGQLVGSSSTGSTGASASPSASGLPGVDALDRVLCPHEPTGGASSGERPSSEAQGASEDGAAAAGPEQAGNEATLRFMVAGSLMEAPAEAMQQASLAVAASTQLGPQPDGTALAVPELQGASPKQLVAAFSTAVAWARAGEAACSGLHALHVWTLADGLQMPQLQHFCQRQLETSFHEDSSLLRPALEAAACSPTGSALAVIATSHLLTELAAEADGRLIAGLTPAAQVVLASSAFHILQERLDNAAAAVALADGHLGGDGKGGDAIHGSPMHAPETPWQLIGNGLVMRKLPVGHETLEVTAAEAGSQEPALAPEGPEEAATTREGTQNCRHIELQTGTLLQKHMSMPLAASAPAQ